MQGQTNIVTQVILPISLAFIMFSLGLALVWADFKRVAVQPRDFFVGAFSQVILLPLVAFALVSVWPTSTPWRRTWQGARNEGCQKLDTGLKLSQTKDSFLWALRRRAGHRLKLDPDIA